MFKKIIHVILVFLFTSYLIYPVYANPQGQDTNIELSAQIDQTEVPLNRVLQLRVTLAWLGSADDYSLQQYDGPSLTNFEIVGTATSNRSEVTSEGTRILNEYTYTLLPQELGMGYIEGVTAIVRDNLSGRDLTLTTERIPVEVTDAVSDPAQSSFPWIMLWGALVVFVVVCCWFFRILKKKRQPAPEPEPPLESQFLDELKNSVNLDQPNLRENFTQLSKLLRSYLTSKYSIRALETTSDELVRELEAAATAADTGLEANQISSIREILFRSDEIKFSGLEGSREELTRFYTLIEGILETSFRKGQEKTEKQTK